MSEPLFSVLRCSSCCRLIMVQKGNHHPWCGACMNDEFDFSRAKRNLTKEEAEKVIADGKI